jgi:hypothetical protein
MRSPARRDVCGAREMLSVLIEHRLSRKPVPTFSHDASRRKAMRRKSLERAECPVAKALDVIGDWWSLLIIRDTHRGRRRFGEFQKSLGVSKNI